MFVNESNWAIFVIMSLFSVQLVRDFHNPCIAAYCTEIAEGEEQLVALQTVGRVLELIAMLVFLAGVGIVGAFIELDVVGTAALGNGVFLVMGLPTLAFASTRLQERPVLREKRTGGSILDPIVQLLSTIRMLWNENRSLLQYLIGVACTDCANAGLTFLMPLYAMQQLNVENPTSLVGLTMVSSIPGALIGKNLGMKWGAKTGEIGQGAKDGWSEGRLELKKGWGEATAKVTYCIYIYIINILSAHHFAHRSLHLFPGGPSSLAIVNNSLRP